MQKKSMYDLCHTFSIEKQLEKNKFNCIDQSSREHKRKINLKKSNTCFLLNFA